MKNWISILKGLAILAVVVTHILSSLPPAIFTIDINRHFFIFIDQSFRFCVPIFVALSGYALSKKYQTTHLELLSFYKRRSSKLLPMYLLWSLVFILLLSTIPAWQNSGDSPSILKLLLLGRADYHLYFVAMIFQLYLIFPFVQKLMAQQRFRHWTVMLMLIIQAVFMIIIHRVMLESKTLDPKPWLASDQHQYFLSLSWIGYFGLGMWLSYFEQRVPFRNLIKMLVTATLFVGWFLVVNSAIKGIEAGGDPLYELRFTRFSILLYAASFSYIVIVHQRVLHFIPDVAQKVISWVGKHSYLIYLCHTLFLRIWFTPTLMDAGKISVEEVALASLVGIIAVGVSLKLGSE